MAAAATASLGFAETDLHVSPQGDDGAPGTRAQPLATLEGARDRVRQLKTEEAPLTVWFSGGTYWFAEPVVFSSGDSGTEAAPVTYRALPGAGVRFSGGQSVGGWSPVTDEGVLARLPEEARPHVLVADLRAQGIEDYGRLGRRGSASGIPREEYGWAEAELFWNDEPMTLARWPNEGFRGIHEVEGEERVTVDSSRLGRWVGEAEPWILAYWRYDWAELYEPIAGLEPAHRVLLRSTELTPSYGINPGAARWYAFNLLAEIDRPGEYYIDRANGLLYFWPPTPSGEAVLSRSDGLVRAEQLRHVTFRGITFEASRGTAVAAEGGAGCKVVGCTIRNVGGRAVQVDGGSNHEVYGCDVYFTGTGGIFLNGGDRATLTPSGHRAENNHVHHYARRKRTYQSAISTWGVGARISHNLIHDGPHMALSAGGNDHVVEYNEIHNVVYESRDAGAFYVGRDFTQRGTVLSYNYWHQILGADGHGGMTIYLDDQHSGHHIHGNLFESVTNAVFIGGGVDNSVTNNVFIDCWTAVHLDNRGMGWQKGMVQDTSWTFHKGLRAVPYKSEVWARRYPTLPGILDDMLGVPQRNLIRRNISAGGIWDDINNATRKFQTIQDNLAFDGDPEWVRLEKDDRGRPARLEFRDPEAVSAIGFEPLPLAQMGLYEDERRASWPVVHEVRPVQFPEPVPQADLPPDPVFTVPRSSAEIAVDGELQPEEWGGLSPESAMVLEAHVSGALVEPAARAWLTHDGSALRVGLVTGLPETRDLGTVWGGSDAVELAFKAADDLFAETQVLRGYTEGTWETTDETGSSEEARQRLARGVRFGARVGDGRWSAEWEVPLANLGISPGDRIRFNLTVRRMSGLRWIMWRATRGQTYDVDGVGSLYLAP